MRPIVEATRQFLERSSSVVPLQEIRMPISLCDKHVQRRLLQNLSGLTKLIVDVDGACYYAVQPFCRDTYTLLTLGHGIDPLCPRLDSFEARNESCIAADVMDFLLSRLRRKHPFHAVINLRGFLIKSDRRRLLDHPELSQWRCIDDGYYGHWKNELGICPGPKSLL